jgi:16S rRNA (cytosine1402-N4)-methyltransferase
MTQNNTETTKILSNQHHSVMFAESLAGLNIKPDGIYIDATFGRGGHSQGILELLGPKGRLIGLDQDLDAVNYAKSNFQDQRLALCHTRFDQLQSVLEEMGIYGKIDGILMDLGVSSPQLDNAERGFSFNKEGALDMRMNQTQTMTAAKWLNETSEKDIADALYQFGEEKKSWRIAAAIKKFQEIKNIETTLELANIIASVVRSHKNKHPATRSFQAIRIVINEELQQLASTLEQSIGALNSGGRLAVISFHSIEDRIVKQFIRRHSQAKALPKGLPIMNEPANDLPLNNLGKKKPSRAEIKTNKRSRSAILRLAEKC